MITLAVYQKLIKRAIRNIDPQYHKLYRSILSQAPHFSFSGFGEDRPLLQAISSSSRGLSPGFYVDLGAYHPIDHSNTFLLHLLGWRGINIDANPDKIRAFEKLRPADINIHAGISDKQEVQTFYDVGFGLGSSFHLDWVEQISQQHNRPIHSATPTKCYPVNDLLERHLPPDVSIDLIDIDLEGHDEMVVHSLDWERFQPQFVLVELHKDNIEQAIASSIYKKLREHNYQMISYIRPTAIFQRQ